jgi:hypothetical protein
MPATNQAVFESHTAKASDMTTFAYDESMLSKQMRIYSALAHGLSVLVAQAESMQQLRFSVGEVEYARCDQCDIIRSPLKLASPSPRLDNDAEGEVPFLSRNNRDAPATTEARGFFLK